MFNKKKEIQLKKKLKNGKLKKVVIYILRKDRNCMHEAGKAVFRITNGSAFLYSRHLPLM